MTYKNEDRKSNDQYNNSILEMIYKDANESCKSLQDNINSTNTRLTLLIGFNATFASLLPKLPIQNMFLIKVQNSQEFDNLYPYAIDIINIFIMFCNWLALIKPLIAILLGISLTLAILGVIPSSIPIVIFPKKMLEKGKDSSQEDFMIGVIKNRDDTIRRLQKLVEEKASNLKYSLITLTVTALFTVLNLLITINVQCN